jgi:acylphosphatase
MNNDTPHLRVKNHEGGVFILVSLTETNFQEFIQKIEQDGYAQIIWSTEKQDVSLRIQTREDGTDSGIEESP